MVPERIYIKISFFTYVGALIVPPNRLLKSTPNPSLRNIVWSAL